MAEDVEAGYWGSVSGHPEPWPGEGQTPLSKECLISREEELAPGGPYQYQSPGALEGVPSGPPMGMKQPSPGDSNGTGPGGHPSSRGGPSSGP